MGLTPHNNANLGDIAETVLLPGDPLRAKFIAENFLEDAVEYNTVRGMYGYTGYYKGKRISVQGSGMGGPSMGIYSFELINFYGVKNLIRIGSAGAIHPDLKIQDLVIGMGACTDSNYASQYNLPGTFAPIASYDLVQKAYNKAQEKGITAVVGNIFSSDIFYNDGGVDAMKVWGKMGVLA
ncbi:MAG: DeoD-type purine-nucleoside phosphorylase, partial [Peptostreptococcaceae bacterium]